MPERQCICIECNFSDQSPAVVINDGISWRGRAWWDDVGHFQGNGIAVEWENNVEVADSNATMTTIAISGTDIMSVVPFDHMINGRPVLIINQRNASHVYVGNNCVSSNFNEPDSHHYVEDLIRLF